MKPVHQYSRGYAMLRPYVDFCTYQSYRRVEIRGRKRIPREGKIILMPNHCNALMDALVVLRTRKGPIAFGARADIFAKKTAADALYFLRILPMVRIRDGLKEVLRNYEAMDLIAETMENEVPFCMFCEGTHRTKHSLLPIKKGGIRAALHAQSRQPEGKDVYLQPIGLEYGDHFRFRSTSLLEFGDPINVSQFLRDHPDLPQGELYRALEEQLKERISALITYIPDDADYEGTWALTRIINAGRRGNLRRRRDRNQQVIRRILEEAPLQQLRERAIAFDQARKAKGISIHSFAARRPVLRVVLKSLLFLILFPVFVVEALLSMPIWLTAEILGARMKDKAFRNTARYGCKLAISPIVFLLLGIVGFLTLPWYGALILLAAFIPSLSCFYDFMEYSRVLLSDIKLRLDPQLRAEFAAIKEAAK